VEGKLPHPRDGGSLAAPALPGLWAWLETEIGSRVLLEALGKMDPSSSEGGCVEPRKSAKSFYRKCHAEKRRKI
jgi:hypothetical protein